MTRKSGLFKVSLLAMMMVGVCAGNVNAADTGIASVSYVDVKVRDAVNDATAPMGVMQIDVNGLKTAVGDTTTLTSTGKTIVGEINDIRNSVAGSDTKVGNLTDLTTTDKTTAVAAINEVNKTAQDANDMAVEAAANAALVPSVQTEVQELRQSQGNLDMKVGTGTFDTDIQQNATDVVGAVNYVNRKVDKKANQDDIGIMGDLGTSSNTIVGAINEVQQDMRGFSNDVNALRSTQGELENLAAGITSNSLVGAINSVKNVADQALSNAGDAAAGVTTVSNKIGDLTQLSEQIQSKDSVVSAINWVQTEVNSTDSQVDALRTDTDTLNRNVGTLTDLQTTKKSDLVEAINEVRETAMTSGPVFTPSGTGNVVTGIAPGGTYNLSNVQIPVGSADSTTYANIWVE